MKKIISTIALLGLFAVCFNLMSMNRSNARLNGNWSGMVATTSGEAMLDYKFQTVGNHLIGTAVSPQGEASIVDGTIKGSDIEFTISFKGTQVKHTGKYYDADGSIEMDLNLGGSTLHATLLKAN